MPSFYTIIQFVPDPVADERINAGVVVFNDSRVRARFVEDWRRLAKFANKDVTFLKTFATELQERTKPGLFEGRIDGLAIREMAASWRNAIQFTAPRGSLLNLDALLNDADERFLANDRQSAAARPHTRITMKKFALNATRLAFDRFGTSYARKLVHRDYRIQGAFGEHPFSLAIANGQPFVAAEVFSFVGSDRRNQERDVHATAFAYEDVHRQYPDLARAALVMTGEEPSPAYEEAKRIFEGLRIELVQKNAVDDWADKVADRVIATMN